MKNRTASHATRSNPAKPTHSAPSGWPARPMPKWLAREADRIAAGRALPVIKVVAKRGGPSSYLPAGALEGVPAHAWLALSAVRRGRRSARAALRWALAEHFAGESPIARHTAGV